MGWRRFKRWLYRGGRPNLLARALNRASATLHALGIAPNHLVTLEVAGRRSGRVITLPLVMAVVDGNRYLVSMLGADVAWAGTFARRAAMRGCVTDGPSAYGSRRSR